MTQIKLGTTVRVSDPCYTDDVWCKTKLTNVKEGMYNVTVEKSNINGWGNRITRLQVVHTTVMGYSESDWEEDSEIGVDSGQAGIFCESSYRNDEVAETIKNGNGIRIDGIEDGDKWYEKMCRFTLGDKGWGDYETGVVTRSGLGDGGYPLDVLQLEDGTIVGMRITYIFDDEEEEEDEDMSIEDQMDDNS